MKLTLALLADYANISLEGKLNVLGIFDSIAVEVFPVVHPEMRLVLRFEAGPSERGYNKEIEVKLIDEDGNELLHLSGQMTVPQESPTPLMRFDQILTLQGVRFDHPGRYRFDILINGQTQDLNLPFDIIQLEPTLEAGAE